MAPLDDVQCTYIFITYIIRNEARMTMTLSGAPARFTLEPPAFQLHAWRPGTGVVTHTAYPGEHPGPFPFE